MICGDGLAKKAFMGVVIDKCTTFWCCSIWKWQCALILAFYLWGTIFLRAGFKDATDLYLLMGFLVKLLIAEGDVVQGWGVHNIVPWSSFVTHGSEGCLKMEEQVLVCNIADKKKWKSSYWEICCLLGTTSQGMVRYLISDACTSINWKGCTKREAGILGIGKYVNLANCRPVSLGSNSPMSLCKWRLYNHSYVIKDVENVEGISKQSIK